jgi:hypothetical protein
VPVTRTHFNGQCHQIFDFWPSNNCLYFFIFVFDFTGTFVNSEKHPSVYTSGGPGVSSCRGKMQRESKPCCRLQRDVKFGSGGSSIKKLLDAKGTIRQKSYIRKEFQYSGPMRIIYENCSSVRLFYSPLYIPTVTHNANLQIQISPRIRDPILEYFRWSIWAPGATF